MPALTGDRMRPRTRRPRWWGLPAVVVVAVALGSCGGAEPPSAQRGAELFAVNCAACHGPAGSGGRPPLTGPEVLERLDEALIRDVVENGRPPTRFDYGPMPPRPLSPDEIDAVVAYLLEIQQVVTGSR